eukprot:92109-Rhodomonas_salina.2
MLTSRARCVLRSKCSRAGAPCKCSCARRSGTGRGCLGRAARTRSIWSGRCCTKPTADGPRRTAISVCKTLIPSPHAALEQRVPKTDTRKTTYTSRVCWMRAVPVTSAMKECPEKLAARYPSKL